MSSANRTSNVVQFKPIKTLPDAVVSTQETFRQTRIDNAAGELSLTVGPKAYKLVNWSRTGVAFETTKEQGSFPVGLKVGPVKICSGGIEVYDGDIEIKTVRKLDTGNDLVGAEFRSRLFLVEGIEAASLVNKCVESLKLNSEEVAPANPELCKTIVELGSALRILKKFCEEQEARLTSLTFDARTEALNIFLPSLAKEVKRVLNSYNRKIGELIDVETIPENTVYHRLFEEHIYPFFKSADLTRRALEKPRGYAGDFEMMNQMYRNGFEGGDLLGKVLHNYAANEDSSESVHFRRPYFIGHMERVLDNPGDKTILSLASGPSIEIQELISRWHQEKLGRVHFVLFDLDRVALEHAQTKIFQLAMDQQKTPNIEFVNASVRSFLKHNQTNPGTFDLVYSGGLFDYLDNITSKAIVQNIFKGLKPGGRMVIGNFTKDNTTKAFCHLLTRWHLIHKTEDEMRAWTEGLNDCEIHFDYDPNHINAFIVITKK